MALTLCLRLFFPVASERIPCIILGVSRFPPPWILPLRSLRPLWELPHTQTLRLFIASATCRAPESLRPSALTCEPSPGPSISPVAAATRQSGGGGPLASPPRAVSTPTSSCDSASTASLARALRRQSASKEPIHGLLSAGGGLSRRQGG